MFLQKKQNSYSARGHEKNKKAHVNNVLLDGKSVSKPFVFCPSENQSGTEFPKTENPKP